MQCPCCDGLGGKMEQIMFCNYTDLYTCGYCKGEATVSIFKYLKWKYMGIRTGMELRIFKKIIK